MIPTQRTHRLQMCHYLNSLFTGSNMLRLKLAIFRIYRHKGTCIFLKLANLSQNMKKCIYDDVIKHL